MYTKPTAKSELEKIFFNDIENETPDVIKHNELFDLTNQNAFVFRLTREQLYTNTDSPKPKTDGETRHPEGLGIYDWFASYEKEAKSSTAGIRGLQNPLYPWDTRYPLNIVGIMLATLGKALVLKDIYKTQVNNIYKLVSSEVRYNSQLYVDLISRIQAACGIKTYRTPEDKVIPIWMASFLIYTEDFCGGEYVTSSHALSKKIATKDLNFQGSQFIPEESIMFVNKIKEIITKVETEGYYDIRFAASDDSLIDYKYIEKTNFGVDKYVDYLSRTVASKTNLQLFTYFNQKIVIDCMGGSMYPTLNSLFTKLNILDSFDFINIEPDPFFHGIGKTVNKEGKIDDLGCDSSIVKIDLESGKYNLPVINTMNYEKKLKNYPTGTLLLITDPDGDRLITAQILPVDQKAMLDKNGILFIELGNDRLLAVYMPNQSFLMNIDYQKQNLENNQQWDKFNWFIVKTTASALSWDEWATHNNVPVINTPVGFKEIATILQKVEAALGQYNGKENILLDDVFGKTHDLGRNPRLLFAGEESGGEIFGPSDFVESRCGKKALAMREKSAGEAILITSMMHISIYAQLGYLHNYLEKIFETNNINGRYDIRVDQKYYNESEPDIVILQAAKQKGIQTRTRNDMYFLSIALMYREGKINIEQVRETLSEAFTELDFSDLEEIYFVGDGTYLRFKKKFVEVRPSGTDAINKAYSVGDNWHECVKYSQAFAKFDGSRNPKHIELIPDEFYNEVKNLGLKILMEFQQKDLVRQQFIVPSNFPE